MGIFTIFLPDVGEGIAEAELTEWNVRVGDIVREDDILGTVMTDKVAVEVPSIAGGKITWLAGGIGEFISIGAEYVKLEVAGEGGNKASADKVPETDGVDIIKSDETIIAPPTIQPTKSKASPAVRKRAKDNNIDLHLVTGSGPAGRITHDDLDSYLVAGTRTVASSARNPNRGVKTVKLVGMRRKIAEKMTLSKSRIPHITIIEEIDVEALEELRGRLNEKYLGERAKLTILPFMMRAIVEAVGEQPEMNALFDDEAGVIFKYGGVHIGIATQTDEGLIVPVVKHAETLTPWEGADEVARLAKAVREGKARRDELSGSTITISSLGPLGAIATTPIINHPEVAIIGINKIAVRPMWDGKQFQPRKMMNISCAFDHRVIDGWNAATFVQKLKSLLETPAMLFVDG